MSTLQVSPEFNVLQFQQKGLVLNFKLDIANAEGTQCWVTDSILYPNKALVVARTGAFADTKGNFYTFKEFVPRYDKTHISGDLFFPYNEFHRVSGTNFHLYLVEVSQGQQTLAQHVRGNFNVTFP